SPPLTDVSTYVVRPGATVARTAYVVSVPSRRSSWVVATPPELSAHDAVSWAPTVSPAPKRVVDASANSGNRVIAARKRRLETITVLLWGRRPPSAWGGCFSSPAAGAS